MTDALVVLGLVDPRNFLGGHVVLDGESAVAALGRLGQSVGLDPDDTARGIYRLAAEQMTLAVKGLLVERGLDPRRFAFVCYGGCGALFGAPIARALGIDRLIVPGLAAVFSAYGAATADVRREVVRTLFRALPVAPDELGACFAELEAEVRAAMAEEGVSPERVALAREVDLRFHRQTWEVSVPLAALDGASVGALAGAFRERYAALYGRGALAQGAGIDLVNCRLVASGAVPRPRDTPAALGPADAAAARRGARAAWMPGASGRASVAVYDGERLAPGMTLAGPAVIDRRDTTILVPAGDRASVDAAGSLVIEVGHGAG